VARSLTDENRMVGHYWLRDPDLAPTETRDIVQTLEQIEAFTKSSYWCDSSSKHPFTDILSIGIGGSALGPQFVAEALAPFPSNSLH